MSNKDKTSSNSMLFFNYFGEGIDDSKFAPGRYLMTVKPPAKSTSSMPKIKKKKLPMIKKQDIKPLKSMTQKEKDRENRQIYEEINHQNEDYIDRVGNTPSISKSSHLPKRPNIGANNGSLNISKMKPIGKHEQTILDSAVGSIEHVHKERLNDKLGRLMDTSMKLGELLEGKYQVNEIDILLQTLKESLSALRSNVEIEMELSEKMREIAKMRIQNSSISNELEQVKEQKLNFKSDAKLFKEQNKSDLEQMTVLKKKLNEEKLKNTYQAHLIEKLEKRLEILLESSDKLIPVEDKLRTALSEIMKENEKLKKEYQIKIREIGQLNEEKKSMKLTITRLNKKIQSLKAKNNPRGDTDEATKNDKKKMELDRLRWREKGENMLKDKVLPDTLEFKNSFLNKDYLTVLNNLHDYGASSFAQYLVGSKKDLAVKQEAISLVCSQYTSFKKFAETMNKFYAKMLKVSVSKTYEELCYNLTYEFRDHFGYDNIKLWLIDESTGVLKTFDLHQNEVKIMANKGLLGESLKLDESTFKKKEKDKYLYSLLSTGKKVSTENTLLNPIWGAEPKPIAVLEVNFSKDDLTHDDEYFVLALSSFLGQIVSHIYYLECRISEVSYKDQYIQAFTRLVASKNYFDFSKKVVHEALNIFFTNNCRFTYIRDNKLIVYESSTTGEIYPLNTGLTGICAVQKKSILVTDISLTEIYNQKVDIYTLLPVLAYPLLTKKDEKETIYAVMQITMRERNRFRLAEKLNIVNESIPKSDIFQHSVKMYTELVLQAFLLVQARFGDHQLDAFKRNIVEFKVDRKVEDKIGNIKEVDEEDSENDDSSGIDIPMKNQRQASDPSDEGDDSNSDSGDDLSMEENVAKNAIGSLSPSKNPSPPVLSIPIPGEKKSRFANMPQRGSATGNS